DNRNANHGGKTNQNRLYRAPTLVARLECHRYPATELSALPRRPLILSPLPRFRQTPIFASGVLRHIESGHWVTPFIWRHCLGICIREKGKLRRGTNPPTGSQPESPHSPHPPFPRSPS